VIGLTGGLASGKSTVARLLAARGVAVLDADDIVHDLYRPGAAGAAAVARIFGPGLLDAAGGVDRGQLGGRVLRDPDLRRALEEAIHPLVRGHIGRWLASLGAVPMAVVEASLLVETGSYEAYDVLVVVSCEERQQLERARARGISTRRAEGLLRAQLPLARKREVADVVIDNSGPENELAAEVARAFTEVVRICSERQKPGRAIDS
jgi:dephospho-CoA kinase